MNALARMFTRSEAAVALGCSTDDLERLAAEGGGPHFAMRSGEALYRLGSLERWLHPHHPPGDLDLISPNDLSCPDLVPWRERHAVRLHSSDLVLEIHPWDVEVSDTLMERYIPADQRAWYDELVREDLAASTDAFLLREVADTEEDMKTLRLAEARRGLVYKSLAPIRCKISRKIAEDFEREVGCRAVLRATDYRGAVQLWHTKPADVRVRLNVPGWPMIHPRTRGSQLPYPVEGRNGGLHHGRSGDRATAASRKLLALVRGRQLDGVGGL